MNETLLKRIEAGEKVSVDDVLRANAAAELAEMEAEANRRAEAHRIEEGREQTREEKLAQMVFYDRQAEAARRKFEHIAAAKEKLLAELEAANQQAVSDWQSAHSKFVDLFAVFVPQIRQMETNIYPNQGELEKRVRDLKDELKANDARLQNVLYNFSQRGRSFIELGNMPPFEFEPETEPNNAAGR